MAIDAARRASLYQKLLPIHGVDANAMMSEYLSVEAAELVTKDFLRTELALTRADLRAEVAGLETRLTLRLGAAIGTSSALLAAIALLT